MHALQQQHAADVHAYDGHPPPMHPGHHHPYAQKHLAAYYGQQYMYPHGPRMQRMPSGHAAPVGYGAYAGQLPPMRMGRMPHPEAVGYDPYAMHGGYPQYEHPYAYAHGRSYPAGAMHGGIEGVAPYPGPVPPVYGFRKRTRNPVRTSGRLHAGVGGAMVDGAKCLML